MSFVVGLVIVILLVAANGFFVAVEFSLVASDRSKLASLAKEGKWPAKAALAAMKQLSFHLSGAQLGITVTSLVLGYLTEPVVSKLVDPLIETAGGSSGSGVSIATALVVATVFQMLAGELIPKNLAISRPETTAQLLSPAARIVHGILRPLIVAFNGTANWTLRLFGLEPQEELESTHSMDDLEYLVRSSAEGLTPDAMAVLTRTFRFGEKTAADVLTPRVHVRSVSFASSVGELIDEMRQSRHSRYLVVGADLDDVKGMVSVQAVFDLPIEQRYQTMVSEIVQQPLILPETKSLFDVLDDFQLDAAQLAVVIDEHGGTAGILTLEDVLEEIVGEVDDEFAKTPDILIGADAGVFVMAGTSRPDEVAETVGLNIPDGEYETIAGFVLDQLGRVPAEGDHFEFDGWMIEVAAMDKLRIASLQFVAPGYVASERLS